MSDDPNQDAIEHHAEFSEEFTHWLMWPEAEITISNNQEEEETNDRSETTSSSRPRTRPEDVR